MYHVVGLTPEAPTLEAAFHGDPPGDGFVVTAKDLDEQREMLSADAGPIEFALLGCPHLSLDQLRAIAARIDGRHFKVEFWVQTSFRDKELAERMGVAQVIEQAGSRLVPAPASTRWPGSTCSARRASEGNACGLGFVDVTTPQLVEKVDLEVTAVNAIAACFPEDMRLPLTLPNERDAIRAMLDTLRPFPAEDLRLVHIRSTLDVESLVVSEGCLPALSNRADVVVEEEPRRLGFDQDARLVSPLSA